MERCKLALMLPTFNRAALLYDFVRRLQELLNLKKFDPWLYIIDDASHTSQRRENEWVIKRLTIPYTFHVEVKNNGRDYHWRLFNKFCKMIRERPFDYAIMFADDLYLCNHFFERVMLHFDWLREQNEDFLAFSYLSSWPRNWAKIEFVDGAFVAVPKFFEVLGWEIPRMPQRIRRHKGQRLPVAGFYKYITYKFANHPKYKIAPISPVSYAKVLNVPSMLLPTNIYGERERNWRWLNYNFIDQYPSWPEVENV